MKVSNNISALTTLVKSLRETTKKNEKIGILKTANDDAKSLLIAAHSSFITYGITSKKALKHPDVLNSYSNLEDLLTDLAERKLTGHNALAETKGFALTLHEEDQETFWGIINKDLKTKTGVSIINSVFPKLIPTFEVALAQTASKASEKNQIDFDKYEYVVSRKLDGLRCVVVVKDGKATAYTRTGNVYTTLSKITDAISEYAKKNNKLNFVLDGEVCIIDENGNEDFAAIQSEYNKKDYTIENPKYVAFDLLTLEEFENEKGTVEYKDRVKNLIECVKDCNSKYIGTVEFFEPKSYKELMDLLDYVVDEKGYEGLMVRKGAYEAKRTWNLQKLKKFHDAEFEVIGVETEVTTFIKYVDEDGNEYLDKCDIPEGVKTTAVNDEAEMVKNVQFKYKGNIVSAGSGLSLRQKVDYFNDPSLIIGKTIQVKYFEETVNKSTGLPSLRFPVVAYVYENGRDA